MQEQRDNSILLIPQAVLRGNVITHFAILSKRSMDEIYPGTKPSLKEIEIRKKLNRNNAARDMNRG